jgi:hypothetical protein
VCAAHPASARHPHCRLEEREALPRPSEQDERLALLAHRERLGVGIAEPSRDLDGLPGEIGRCRPIRRAHGFWSGLPVGAIDSRIVDGFLTGLVPTNEGLTLVWAGGRAERFQEFRDDIEANMLRAFDRAGNGELVRAGRREERLVGTGPTPTFYRQSWGDGWALLGDAGYHEDPVTGQGITDAFAQAELVAEAVHEGLSGARPMGEALGDYQRRRDERSLPFCEWTYRLSALGSPSDRVQVVLRSLPRHPDELRRFMGLNACTVSPADFFSPENIARIVAEA